MSLIEKLIRSIIGVDKISEPEMVTCIDFHDGTLRKQARELTNCFDKKRYGIRICCASQ